MHTEKQSEPIQTSGAPAARRLQAQRSLAGEFVTQLRDAEERFRRAQGAISGEIGKAVLRRDASAASRLIDRKREQQYRPLHDGLIEYKAGGYDWVVKWFGPGQLRDCQHHLAQTQQAGFTKWEQMTVEDHVRQAAMIFSLHLGRTRVMEEPQRYRFVLDPCGTGGRMALSGSLTRPVVFHEKVPGRHRFTFNRLDFPAYCAHCSSWNEIAATEWFGHPQWVFTPWSSPGEPCGFSIYKDPNDIPAAHYAERGLTRGGDLRASKRGAPFGSQEIEDLGKTPSELLGRAAMEGEWDIAGQLVERLAKEYIPMVKGLRLVLEPFAAYNLALFARMQDPAPGPLAQPPATTIDVDRLHEELLSLTQAAVERFRKAGADCDLSGYE